MPFHTQKTTTGLCIAGALALAACGGNSSIEGPGTSSITISSAGGPLFIGSTTQFEARETLQDGTTRPAASVGWSSDRPQVASVSNLGVVTAVAAGEAAIAADANGARGLLPIRVFPNFAGDWAGRETAVSCVDSRVLTGFCSVSGIVGEVFLHSSSLTQTLAAVTAVFETNDDQRATMTGSITIDGELRLNSGQALPPDPEFNLQIENWKTRSDTPSRMTGTYDAVLDVPGLTGSARVGVRLDSVMRVSASTAAASRGVRSGSTLRSRIRARMRAPGQ